MLEAKPRRLSVVIPSLNGQELLRTCLPALKTEIDELSEVLVVDNGSADGTVQWLAEHWPRVVVLEQGQNTGFAAACNAGAREAAGTTVIFLNNDAIVTPGWAGPLLEAIETHDEVVIAGGLTVFADCPDIVNSAGTRLTPSAAGVDIGFGLPVEKIQHVRRPVAGVSGVSMAVQRTWFLASGGFDEKFFMYFEDVELCLRAWLEGFKVLFVPDSVVLHKFGGTSGSRHTPLRNYYGSRNRILTAAKSFDGLDAVVAVALSLLQDCLVVGHLALTGRWLLARRTGQAKFRGAFAALRMASRFRKERECARHRRRRSTRVLRAEQVIDSPLASLLEFIRFRRLR